MAAGTVLAIFLFLRELLLRARRGVDGRSADGRLPADVRVHRRRSAGGQPALPRLRVDLLHARPRLAARPDEAACGRDRGGPRDGHARQVAFLALVPGAALALALLAWRIRGGGRRRALAMFALAVGVAAARRFSSTRWRTRRCGAERARWRALSSATSAAGSGPSAITWHVIADYTWQLYLPRLSFMNHVYFPGAYPLWSTWLDGSIGHFGILDYTFPAWVYRGLPSTSSTRLRHSP